MRCSICDAKLPDTQSLDIDICSDCRTSIRQALINEPEEFDWGLYLDNNIRKG